MRRHLFTLLAVLTVFSNGRGEDPRLGDPVTLHDYHPFRPVEDLAKWSERREAIQTRILLGSGLLPMPEKTPLNAKRFGAVERDGFRVERVYFESFPGHFVTGSLFLPTGESAERGLKEGRRPGVLCPHGHWSNGRFYDAKGMGGGRGVTDQLASGAERFETAARNPIISRCVQLARMGCTVFSYDMLGYADSIQFEEHRRGPREEMSVKGIGKWGFVSPQATLRLQTNFGLQTWNSVRALDFLAGLEDIDPDRLAVTGASGGGTQTMIIAAIDERIDASFPCVMPSTAMQGGCTCENTHYLRIGQGNIDISAATAPKPLGMTAADDWTIELETKGHPDLKALYEGLKAPNNYQAHFDIHFKHNYNHVSRTHMYGFINRHFQLGLDMPVLEADYEYLGKEDLTVWPDPEKRPEGFRVGDDHERDVNRVWAEDGARQWKAAKESGGADWVRAGWRSILRAEEYGQGPAVFDLGEKEKRDGVVVMDGTIRRETNGETVSARVHYPVDWDGSVTIRVGGGAGVPDGSKATWIFPELFQGSNSAATYSGKKEVAADSWQRSPVYFYGYNDSAFVRRAHDLVAVVLMAKDHPDWDVKNIRIEAEGANVAIALAAKVIVGDVIDEVVGETRNFRFEKLDDMQGKNFVPGAVRYGDVDGLRMAAE
jgi:dienelactone hydrolase